MTAVIQGLRSRGLITQGYGPASGNTASDNRNAVGINSRNRATVGTDGRNRAVGGRAPNT